MFNPKQVESLMKKMGVKTTQIPAEEVVIKGEKTIRIKNPSVTVVEMQGSKSFQITGDAEEEEFSEEDIKLVSEQTGKSIEEAKKALEKTKDIAEAIIMLKEKQED